MLLEADKPLSNSLIWDIQRTYFESAGMQAWQDDVVPHTISCNPFMARAYANLIKAYLHDMAGQIDPEEPIYIVELGAGSGRLTHHLIHKLGIFGDEAVQFKFVLTDFADSIIENWRSNPQLTQLVEYGVLDFAKFDVMNMGPLQLINSGETLSPDSTKNPVILLANYFFDSIPQDSFVIKNGELQANLLSLYSPQHESQLSDPTIWERLSLAYEPLPFDPNTYKNDLYNQILLDYEAYFEDWSDTGLSFPNIGLDCINYWMGFGAGLLLSADRGFSNIDSMIGEGDPLPNLHGSFSMMVNYHAITEFVERSGGRAFVPSHYQDNLQTVAYAFQMQERTLKATELAFEQTIIQNSPDDFFGMRYHLLKQIPEMSIDQLVSFLRWSAGDADVVRVALDVLPKLVEADPAWTGDVVNLLTEAKAQYLAIREDDDLIGRIEKFIA